MREDSVKSSNDDNNLIPTQNNSSTLENDNVHLTNNNSIKEDEDDDDGRHGGGRRRRRSGRQNTLVKLHDRELSAVALKYSQILAESFFLENVKNCTYADFDTYVRKAHSALLAFLKLKTLDPEDPNLLLRALYTGRVPENSPLKPKPSTLSVTSDSSSAPSTTDAINYETAAGGNAGSPSISATGIKSANLNVGISTPSYRTAEQDASVKSHNVNSVSNFIEIGGRTTSSFNPSMSQQSNSHGWSSLGFNPTPSTNYLPQTSNNASSSAGPGGGQPPKKYNEKLKAEASVVQRISELQKEGMWYDKRLPRNQEPARVKSHWDYLLEEMTWLAADFATERKWKRLASKKCAKMVDKYWSDLEVERARAEKEEEIRLRRIASFIAKEIKNFWSNAQQIVEYKEQSRIEEMKKKALDQQLSYIVDQTEKYSSMLAESFVADSINQPEVPIESPEEVPQQQQEHLSDDEFEPAEESEEDDEETIAKEEEEDDEGQTNSINELDELKRSGQMSLDDLLDDLPPGYLDEWTARIEKIDPTGPSKTETKEDISSGSSGNDENPSTVKTEETSTPIDEIVPKSEEVVDVPVKSEETEPVDALDAAVELVADASDVPDSASDTENESEMEESGSASDDGDQSTDVDESDVLSEEELAPEDEEQTMGLASLLQTFAPERAGENHEDAALNSVAAMAESFQPKGYTLSSTTVVTKVPFLLHHKLREYQHIGLDWLVTMYEKKLNGILADEMGLGKTIQTIALLAHLACEKGNWGPHLVVVPTSVMLNWEMEFKKWCPGFKILTYYGSIKERRLKRTGWTKPNAFHVCITSYKLVIQDHAAFRRKRWKYLILDEAQNIKNFKSQRWQLLLNFSTQRRLLLTGTPLQNNLMELWSLMHFLMPNVFQSHREFREWFSNPVTGMVEGNSDYNEAIISRLHKVLRPFILRRLKSEVEKQLPQKYEHVVMCRLSKRQRFLYEDFMSRAKTKETLSSGNLLSVINVLMQLRKVCNHPNLFEPRPVISPFQCDGLTYLMPSIVWHGIDNYGKKMGTSAVFSLSSADKYFTKTQVERIRALRPLEEDVTLFSAEMAKNDVTLKRKYSVDDDTSGFQQEVVGMQETSGSSPKKSKFSQWCSDISSSVPRSKGTISFLLMTTDDPTPYLEDDDFVEAVGHTAPRPISLRLSDTIAMAPDLIDSAEEPFSDLHEEVIESTADETVSEGNLREGNASIVTEVKSPIMEVEENEILPCDEDDDDIKPEDEGSELEEDDDDEDSLEEGNESDVSDTTEEDTDDGPPKKRRRREVSRRTSRLQSTMRDTDELDSSRDEFMEDATADDSCSSDDDDRSTSAFEDSDRQSKSDARLRYAAGAQWVEAMNYNPFEFQEADVQARSLRNRKTLIERLQFINQRRCEILPIIGTDAVDHCRVIGSLPMMRYYGTRIRHLKLPYRKSAPKDGRETFKLGYEEVASVSLVKNSTSSHIRNHPLLLWRHTKALMNLVWTLEEVLEEFQPILRRFILYVPAVSSTATTSRIFRPDVSLYANQQLFQQELREGLKEPIKMLHPILSAMATQFPDPRLIQYDCGKLQVLESLLRRLKSGSHRVLIFTQMAKMLDVLEAFLNYHGHIYLRLDGSTRIDQRQILMEKFNSDKRIFCFILSTRSGGIGVNLTGADTVIFYDSDWNPTMDAQAQDRCHRIGQTRDVHIYRLVSEKTIEENILKKSNQKRFLSELAIEGGNFTTAYFQKSSIYELFNVQSSENDALKRLTDQTPVAIAEKAKSDTADPEVPDTDRNKIQLFESALAAAEDETDVEATRNVQAEAAAELAEFDESIPLEELGDGQEIPEASAIDAEMESIMAELSKVEIYALKFMERTIDDWSRETVAQAQKELEQQKKEWELEQARQLELRSKRLGDFSDDEEMITYASGDAENQVWISQGGSEDLMPLWAPPTPPSDEMDVYVDYCHGFLYDYGLIPEASLPPVYQAPKKEKKSSPASVVPAPIKQAATIPIHSQVVPMDEDGSNASSTTVSSMEKKSPKVARRDEPIFPPRSLFDRPSPAVAKLRREHRLQKYNCRPMGATTLPKTSLGPGAVTFPIVHPPSTKTPSAPPQHETVEWMIAEDNALLQTIQNILEMPLSLLVVNLAQTPNWDLAAEMVNATSKIYRTPKQCKNRYESTVRPREKGELFYEQPAASKNKKKSKSFIKVGPPSPSRTGRIVKMSQLITADNNSQLLNTYMAKFDVIKNIAGKRVASKPLPANPHVKAVKQAAVILSEHSINVDAPVTATAIAQARFERVQTERRKLYAAQQAAVAAASGTTMQASHGVTPAPYNSSVTPESSRITASTISVSTGGAVMSSLPVTSSMGSSPGMVSMTGAPVLQSQPLSVSSGTVLTATASEVHKAKQLAAAAQQQVSSTDLPVIKFNHPSSSTTLQEMIARRVATASSSAVTSTSNTALVTKRQYTVSQQHNQLQQQLQLLQQHQLSQKHPKIALQVTQIKSSQSGTSLQQGGQVQQIQSSTPQQIVISQPSMTKSQLGTASQMAASALQVQGTKQVVMAYPQSLNQQQKQNTSQPIQIQLSGSNQSAVASISSSQQLHVATQSQPGLMNQSGQQQITSTGIQLQSSTKQVMMTGQAPIVVQQPSQQQGAQSQIISQPTTIQIQGPKQVVMAYQSNLPGTSQPQLIHTKAAQGTQPAQVHVHLHPQSTSHQGSTLVLPSGLAQALNSVVSSAAMTSTGLMTMTTSDSIVSSVNVSTGITTSSFSTAGINRGQLGQQITATQQSPQGPRTVTMQLVKQHAVGGKTVTRTVSDAEITAFLKQHGLAAPGARVAIATAQPGGQSQLGQITATKGPGSQQVQVPAAQIITSVGLQKLGYQIGTSTSGAQVATVLKPSPGQPSVSTSQGTGLAFPLSFSSVKTVGQKSNVPKQTGINTTVQQQVITAQRRQQQPQQPTASKLAHMAQVSQGNVPQLIVQATPKQLQSALNVQSIQSALKPGQTIQGQQGGVLPAQLLTQKSVSRAVSTAAAGAPVTSVSGVNATVTTVSNPVSAVSTVTIPTGIVTSQGQPGIIRISQQNQPVRTGTIQMIGGQTVLLNQQQSVTRPYLTHTLNTNVTAPVSTAPTVAVRLQGPGTPIPADTPVVQATTATPAAPTPQSTVTDTGSVPPTGDTSVTTKSDEAVVPDISNTPTN